MSLAYSQKHTALPYVSEEKLMPGKINVYGNNIADTLSEYRKQGFVNDQLHELRLGLESGVDIKKYADKEYFAVQMRQLRFGLEEGLDISLYNSKQYDWFQMEEIRLGLQAGVDAASYADPKYSFEVMRELRSALEDGIQLAKYAQVGAEMLHQLHKAILDKQNIMPYIRQGYVPEQLTEIRRAMRHGCDIDPYLDTLYRGVAIREITEGLERGLDVSVYAHTEYSWRQMREIRKGLEKRVNVSIYAKELYSWQQMHEIRIGLEEKLDVGIYKSMMYSASDMKKIRKKLELDQKKYVEFIKGSHRDEIPKDIEKYCRKIYASRFHVLVDPDKMKAYAFLGNEAAVPTEDEVNKVIATANVSCGVDENIVNNFLHGKIRDELVVIARGKLPTMGRDGYYECTIKTDADRGIRFLDDGSVNLKDAFLFTKVRERQKVLVYHGAEKGVNGYTVDGGELTAVEGRELGTVKGRGFRLLEDGITYLSEEDGCAKFDGSRLEIMPLLEMSEATNVSGEVNFDGCIHIKGDVTGNCTIKASEDIVVEGFVENAVLECGGSMLIKKGSNGNGTAKLTAGKALMGRFFENISVNAESVQGNYFFRCNVHAARTIRTFGKGGAISGGSAYAGIVIETGNVGNKNEIVTNIRLGIDTTQEDNSAQETLKEIESELVILNNAMEQFKKIYPPEVRNTMLVYLKIENAIYTKELEKKTALEQIEQQNLERQEHKKAYIKVYGTLFEGTTVAINNAVYSSGTLKGVMLNNEASRINIYRI